MDKRWVSYVHKYPFTCNRSWRLRPRPWYCLAIWTTIRKLALINFSRLLLPERSCDFNSREVIPAASAHSSDVGSRANWIWSWCFTSCNFMEIWNMTGHWFNSFFLCEKTISTGTETRRAKYLYLDNQFRLLFGG